MAMTPPHCLKLYNGPAGWHPRAHDRLPGHQAAAWLPGRFGIGEVYGKTCTICVCAGDPRMPPCEVRPRAGCGRSARPVRWAGTGNGAKTATEVPARGESRQQQRLPRPI